jgi:hypothetical protein
LQADGKVLLAGFFTTVGGVARNGIARLENDPPRRASMRPQLEPHRLAARGSSPEAAHRVSPSSCPPDGGSVYLMLVTARA